MTISAAGPHAGNDIFVGTGSPEGSVTAGIGTMYLRTDGASNTVLYIKEVGSGTTGWKAATTAGAAAATVDASASAAYRANMNRVQVVTNTAALTTQVMLSTALYLYAGDVVTNLTFTSGATAAGTPTNYWFALYSSASTPALLSQSADQTSTAWAANTAVTLALGAAQTIATSGVYYAAIMVKATTPPTLAGVTLENAAAAGALVTSQKVLAQTSGSSLTTTAPSTIASPTTVATVPIVIAT
jgi:hypothetical protein